MVGFRAPCPCCGNRRRPPAALNRCGSCPIPGAALPPPTKIPRSSSDPFPFTCISPGPSDDRLEIRPSPILLLPPVPNPAPPRPPRPSQPRSSSDLPMDPISPCDTLMNKCFSSSPTRPIIDPAKINVSDAPAVQGFCSDPPADPISSPSKSTEPSVPVSDLDPDQNMPPHPLPHLVLASPTEKKVENETEGKKKSEAKSGALKKGEVRVCFRCKCSSIMEVVFHPDVPHGKSRKCQ